MERGAGDDLEADVILGVSQFRAGTDWESCYQRGETPWDKGSASPGLIDFLACRQVTGRVLVPGCGLGHDVRALSAAGARVVGLDIAPTAVDVARRVVPVGEESYEQGDLLQLAPELRGGFDWVWEHTCFCAIEPSLREAYVGAVASALRPGGRLLAVFYLDPGHGRGEDGPPFGVSPAELDWFFGGRFHLLEEWTPVRAYSGRLGRERMRLMQLNR